MKKLIIFTLKNYIIPILLVSGVLLFAVSKVNSCSHNQGQSSNVVVKIDSFFVESKDTIDNPVPVYVSGDTIHDTIMAKVDTALILHDYFKARKYDFDFSSDSTGMCKINVTVTRNQIEEITSLIQSKVKTITVTKTEYVPKVPFAQVFATVGSNARFTTQKAQIGLDFKQKYIIGATGIRYLDKFSYTFDVGIKF